VEYPLRLHIVEATLQRFAILQAGNVRLNSAFQVVQAIKLRCWANQHVNVVALAHAVRRQMRSDKTRAADDQDSCHT